MDVTRHSHIIYFCSHVVIRVWLIYCFCLFPEDEPSLYLKCTLAVANGTISFSQSPAIVTGTGGSYIVIGNYRVPPCPGQTSG